MRGVYQVGEFESQNPDARISRNPARSFEDLSVWQKAHTFVLSVYRYTAAFPKNELYGLTSQFQRAAVSIPANIAEGFKKKVKNDKARFMNIAPGSLEGCRYYLILSRDLGYGSNDKIVTELEETSKLLERYLRAILNSRF